MLLAYHLSCLSGALSRRNHKANRMTLTMKNGELRFSKKTLRELANTVFQLNKDLRLNACGSSMSPVIKNGDTIVISPLHNQKIRCGDILAFENPDRSAFTVHRLVKKNGANYFFRGDNSLGPIEIVESIHLLGRLTSVERNGNRMHFGLGPERLLIGLLNRNRTFSRMIRILRRFKGQMKRREV